MDWSDYCSGPGRRRTPHSGGHGSYSRRLLRVLRRAGGEPNRQPDYFFLGLLSSIDVLLRRPMRAILGELPIADDVSAALLGEKSPMHEVLETVLSYERGDWDACSRMAKKLALKEEKLCELHLRALRWGSELTHAHQDEPAEVKCS